VLERIPNSDPEKLNILQGHSIFGIIIGLLMIARYLNIKLRGKPDPIDSSGKLMRQTALWAHRIIYLLVFITVATGLVMAVQADFPAVFSGVATLPESFNHLTARTVHNLSTNLLILVLLAHISAALYHQLIMRDKILHRLRWKRMD
jgi:cytochrome b561